MHYQILLEVNLRTVWKEAHWKYSDWKLIYSKDTEWKTVDTNLVISQNQIQF